MTTTPTLRDAAQAILKHPRDASGRIFLDRRDQELLRDALANNDASSPAGGFDRWLKEEMLKAGAKSGDAGTLALAAQLAGVPPCGACGYVKTHCRCAALAAPADALAEPVAPFGYWHQGATEEESDFFKHGDMGNVACDKCITLYTAPPATQLQHVVARALEPIQQAIRDYHYALDTRQHGGIAERNAFADIRGHLGMHWVQGEEAAIRAKGQQK